MPKTAPYGSWKSPITSDLIVAQSIALSEARLDGEKIYWLEGRPQEQGRFVVVGADWRGGNARDLTPEPYSARTRVHEYGGASWTVADGDVHFSTFSDGRRLLWLAWDHPNMPWNGTTLYLAELDEAGSVVEPQPIAGGVAESIFQPEWSPDGRGIFFVSDRSNWWNLYRYDLAARTTE